MFLPVKSMKTPNYIVVYIFYYKENVQLFGFKKSTFCCRTQYARQNMYWCRNKLPITCTDMSNQASNIQKTMRGNRAHVGLVLFHTMLQQQGHQNYSKGNNKNKKRYVRLSSLMRRIIHIVIFFVNLPNNWSVLPGPFLSNSFLCKMLSSNTTLFFYKHNMSYVYPWHSDSEHS